MDRAAEDPAEDGFHRRRGRIPDHLFGGVAAKPFQLGDRIGARGGDLGGRQGAIDAADARPGGASGPGRFPRAVRPVPD